MNFERLKEEILTDPAGLGYPADPQAAADLCNAESRTAYVDVDVADLAQVVLGNETILTCLATLAGGGSSGASRFLELVRGQTAITRVRYSLTSIRDNMDQILDQLAAADPQLVDGVAAIKALGTVSISRADELGLGGRVKPGHIQIVRAV